MRMTHWQQRGGDEINRTLAGEWLTAGRFSAPPPAHVGRCVTDAEWRTELRRVILTATSVSAATRRPPGCCTVLLPAVEVSGKVLECYLMSTLNQDESLPSRNVFVENRCKGRSLNHASNQLLSSGDPPHLHGEWLCYIMINGDHSSPVSVLRKVLILYLVFKM